MRDFTFFLSLALLEGKLHSFGAISRRPWRRTSTGRPASCRAMERPGPLLADPLTASGGDAAPHAPVEAAVLQCPHSITTGGVTTSAPTPSRAYASKKASATHLPHAPVQPPMAQSIPASTQAAEEDGAMDDAQQVLEESPTRLC